MYPSNPDIVVVGSGPNGLAAAIHLQKSGLSVMVVESYWSPGGGVRSSELTLPGYIHDVCSAIHPLAVTSPFFKSLPLDQFGLEWISPEVELAHPFDDGTAFLLHRSVEKTASQLGIDSSSYQTLFKPLVANWAHINNDLYGPLKIPDSILKMARFAYYGLQSAEGLAKRQFKTEKARAVFAGLAAHSILPLDQRITAAFGIVLGILGHDSGWVFPKGGAQKITDALAGYFKSLGGKIVTGQKIGAMSELPSAKAILFDLTPRQLLNIKGLHFPGYYRKQLESYRYGPGVFKMDWALSEPVPFKDKNCLKATTIHLGGSMEEIIHSEKAAWECKIATKPFVILAQHSISDETRAPEGKHTLWGYCHIPNGSDVNMSDYIEDQIERFAPGFRDTILARHVMGAGQMEMYNPNYVGGDINGGAQNLRQLYTRPTISLSPYKTPTKGIYICSSSTPPGGGVHGMCGYHAARQVLKDF